LLAEFKKKAFTACEFFHGNIRKSLSRPSLKYILCVAYILFYIVGYCNF